MSKIIITSLVVLTVCYTGVLVAILVDLWSGLRKASREGKPLTSHGLRRTVAKLSSYYSALFALTAVDAMLIAAAIGLRACGGEGFPPFPYISTTGAIGLSLIEVKSVLENTNVNLGSDNVISYISKILSFWKGTKF